LFNLPVRTGAPTEEALTIFPPFGLVAQNGLTGYNIWRRNGG
jgi:hypothetical protein